MPSAWHRLDDREFSDPPLLLDCDTPNCNGTVRIAAEDWHDNDGYWCHCCVLSTLAAPHPVDDWPDMVPA